jgi:hypothetical protein
VVGGLFGKGFKMSSIKSFIKACEGISLIAYKDADALAYIFSAETYKKWDTFELDKLLCRLEMISTGDDIPKDALNVFVESLIATLNQPVSELITEIKQDIAIPLQFKYDEEKIRSAEKIFIEALRAESLKIYGVKHIGDGNVEEIPMKFLRRTDYRIDVRKNCFYFDLQAHGNLVLHNIVKRVEHIQEWENLQVRLADISRLCGEGPPNVEVDLNKKLGRPTPEQVRDIIRTVYSEAEGKKPNIAEAEKYVRAAIRRMFEKPAGKDKTTKLDLIRVILDEEEFGNQRISAGKRFRS